MSTGRGRSRDSRYSTLTVDSDYQGRSAAVVAMGPTVPVGVIEPVLRHPFLGWNLTALHWLAVRAVGMQSLQLVVV